MVCEQALAVVAERLSLGAHLLLGHGEEQGGGRNRPSILADAVESVIAACFLDGGMAVAKQFIKQFVLCDVPVTRLHNVDYKTALQELIQKKKEQTLSYELIGESGPDHDKRFTVAVYLNGQAVGEGIGSSKKRAEQEAARAALEVLFPGEN
jgi:ribonuclease-3